MLDFLGETNIAQAVDQSIIRAAREKIQGLVAGQMG